MATEEAPSPALSQAFEMALERGKPVSVGHLASGGLRTYVPVTGGRFIGEGMLGTVVGGGETLFERANGVTVVEAVYYVENQSGWTARAFGNGYSTVDGEFQGTRMTLLFEADNDGPLAHLATNAFVAEQLPGANVVVISRII